MNKVYLVTHGDYSDYGVCAVFSTRELADKYVNGHNEYNIEEWGLDDNTENAIRTSYTCAIGLQDSPKRKNSWDKTYKAGEIYQQSSFATVANVSLRVPEDQELHDRSFKCLTVEHLNGEEISRREEWRTDFTVQSFVSAEHARKLAVEAYQAYLRVRALES